MSPVSPAAARVRLRTAAVPSGRARDSGMSTAEYAIGTVTACAFAAVLYLILTGSDVRALLTRMVTDALQVTG